MMKKKRFLGILLAVSMTACLLLVGCGGSGGGGDSKDTDAALEGFSQETIDYLADKDFSGQTLVVGVWGGDYETILRETVIPVLEAKGASVELLLGGAGDRLAKLYAEKGNPSMDIAYLNVHTAKQAVDDGVIEDADSSLPVYDDLYPFAQNQGGYGAAVAPVGIQYNKDVFSEPPTWEDLFLPEYAGKVALPTWPSTGTDTLLGVTGRLLGGDEHDTDAIIDKLKELKPIPLVFTSNDELAQYMSQGIIVAAPNQSSYAQVLNEQYDNLGFVLPEEPCSVLAMDMLTIVKGCKNPELALAFAQLALDAKTQTAFAEQAYFGPTNSTVELSDDVASKVVYGKDEVSHLTELDWSFILETRKDLTEKWNKELIEE